MLAILACMRRVTVTQLKNELSRFLRLVKQGEIVEVLEHSVPVAQLIGAGSPKTASAGLERLVRDGIVTRARKKPYRAFLKEPPVPCKVDPVNVLIEERGDR